MNKQVGWFLFTFQADLPTGQTLPLAAQRTTAALRRRCASFARFVFKRQPTRVPAAGKLLTTVTCEPAATWGAPQQSASGEFQPNNSLHSLACTIDQPSYFNKLSPFLILSSLLCTVLSSAAFLANDEIFQYHSPCNLYVNNKKWVPALLPAAFTN